MKVYVLMESVKYEGDSLEGVYADYDEAKKVCALLNAKSARDVRYYIETKIVIGSNPDV